MSALIVWNNGESYDSNDTLLIAVDPIELDDVVKLIELHPFGCIQATAHDAQLRFEPYSLDEWMSRHAFHVLIPWDEEKREKNHATVMELPQALRDRLAAALLLSSGHHESHNAVIADIFARMKART